MAADAENIDNIIVEEEFAYKRHAAVNWSKGVGSYSDVSEDTMSTGRATAPLSDSGSDSDPEMLGTQPAGGLYSRVQLVPMPVGGAAAAIRARKGGVVLPSAAASGSDSDGEDVVPMTLPVRPSSRQRGRGAVEMLTRAAKRRQIRTCGMPTTTHCRKATEFAGDVVRLWWGGGAPLALLHQGAAPCTRARIDVLQAAATADGGPSQGCWAAFEISSHDRRGSTFMETHGTRYNALFPSLPQNVAAYAYDAAAGSASSAAAAQQHCCMTCFAIKPQRVKDFIVQMLAQCHEVLATQPRMLRYDLHQCANEPTRFVLYQVAEDDSAMATYASKPFSANVREMEAIPCRELPATGRYRVRAPTNASTIGYSKEWRARATAAV